MNEENELGSGKEWPNSSRSSLPPPFPLVASQFALRLLTWRSQHPGPRAGVEGMRGRRAVAGIDDHATTAAAVTIVDPVCIISHQPSCQRGSTMHAAQRRDAYDRRDGICSSTINTEGSVDVVTGSRPGQ